jgi:hypothetical protein
MGRHSGAAPGVVILAQPPQVVILSAAATEIVILAQPPQVVILSAAKNPRIGFYLFLFVFLAQPHVLSF